MTRGNQRDLAREKNQKSAKGKAQKSSLQEGNLGLSQEQRKIRDAEIMRQKQLAKAQAKEQSSG